MIVIDCNVDWYDVNFIIHVVSLLQAKNVRLQIGRGGGSKEGIKLYLNIPLTKNLLILGSF